MWRGRNVVSAILQRGSHALAALAHGSIGQANGGETFVICLDPGDIDFHVDHIGINPINGSAAGFIEHPAKSLIQRAKSARV